MKKILLSIGAVAAVAAPVAAVIACSDETTTVTKESLQAEFVTDMDQVSATNYSWVIDDGSKLQKEDTAANALTFAKNNATKAAFEGAATLVQRDHAVVFKDKVGAELAADDSSSYKWTTNNVVHNTIYKIITFNQIAATDYAIGTLEASTNGVASYYAFIANKKTEGVLVDHDVTGNFYYSTADAFAKTADGIKVTAKDEEHAKRLGSISDTDLIAAWKGALVETGLTDPTA